MFILYCTGTTTFIQRKPTANHWTIPRTAYNNFVFLCSYLTSLWFVLNNRFLNIGFCFFYIYTYYLFYTGFISFSCKNILFALYIILLYTGFISFLYKYILFVLYISILNTDFISFILFIFIKYYFRYWFYFLYAYYLFVFFSFLIMYLCCYCDFISLSFIYIL